MFYFFLLEIMISFVYSSGGGNTRMVVEYIANSLADQGYEIQLQSVVGADEQALFEGDIIILAAPTYDHGVLHTPFEKYLDSQDAINLEGRTYGVIGLGDDKYDHEYNCESGYILADFVKAHGGILLTDPLLINKHPITQLGTLLDDRIQSVLLPQLSLT